MIIVVPAIDDLTWPSLGPQVCDFIEAHLTFGPGDLLGNPAIVDEELRAYIHALYQVYPKGHPEEGRRRIKRGALSLPKGSRKTEFAAWVTICEAHHQAPVRTVGWDKKGQPIGGPVNDPFIPMVAYTEEQTEDLAYAALMAILMEDACDIGKDFDIGQKRVLRRNGRGKVAPYASAPNARDGALTTFQHFDETHTMTSDRLKKAHRAMLRNIPKRKIADGWSLETTTAYVPGAGSVAEETMEYAKAVAEGRVTDASLFFYHRQASEKHDVTTVKGLRAAVKEARGPVTSKWADIRAIVGQFKDPTADRSELGRTWLNIPSQASDRAFDSERWASLARPNYTPERGALIALGFDGSKYDDATALIATEIETGFQFPVGKGIWEKPLGELGKGWEVPEAEVDQAVAYAFDQWEVWKFYADPPYWESMVNKWVGEYGEERVIKWLTNKWPKVAVAVRAYVNAMKDGEMSHDGDVRFARHIGNAHKRLLPQRNEDGQSLWIIQKDRPHSPNKMDAAMAGLLSWTCRGDAVAAGVVAQASEYERRMAAERARLEAGADGPPQELIDAW